MILVAVGSYTEAYGPFRARGAGVTLIAFDSDSGRAEAADVLPLGPNPAYLRPFSATRLHAVLEAHDARAAIATIEVDAPRQRLRLRHRATLDGRIPCHVDIDRSGAWIATACYGGGEVILRRLADGEPGEVAATVRHRGAGPHPVRQTQAHPHCVRFAPDDRWLLVPDLGTDDLVCYPFDAESGGLGQPGRLRSPAGAGPRLLLFSPDGRHALMVEELASRLAALRWSDGAPERLADCATTDVSPNTAAGLRWHPSGRLAAVSNRGANTIALFSFDPESGTIALTQTIPSGGAKPRDFDFSPCGRWLLVANQDGDSIVVNGVDPDGLSATGERGRITIASPSCVRFLPSAAASAPMTPANALADR